MKPSGNRNLSIALLALLLLCGTPVFAAVTATVDRTQISMGDTLRLTISATAGEEISSITLRELQTDFEVLRRSVNSSTRIVNGQRSHTKELLLDITPRREGNLLIPALRVDSELTQPIAVVVGAATDTALGGDSVVFEAELDSDTVYVQGQLILTLGVQRAIALDEASVTTLSLDNAFVKPLEQKSFTRRQRGQEWRVDEVRYAIFPEQSGTLEIPAQSFYAREAVPQRSLFDINGRGRPIRRNSDALSVTVLPRPDTFPGDSWLPARDLQLQETWSAAPEQLRAGDSVTRTLRIRAEGLQGAQLPPILFPATQGLKYYPDQPDIGESEVASGLLGMRTESVAIVPTQAGRFEIPEVRIPWWDTQAQALRYAVLPSRTVEVAPAPGAANLTPPAASDITDPAASPALPGSSLGFNTLVWQLIALFAALGWASTLAYLVVSRWYKPTARPSVSPPAEHPPESEKRAYRRLLAACAGSDAGTARKAVIDWATARFNRTTNPVNIVSLDQVAVLAGDAGLRTQLQALDQAIYGSSAAPWDGSALDAAVRQYCAKATDKPATETDVQLYPLPGKADTMSA
tara:strand:+ start:128351 stop:130081 length:1731 start_codon:yes stop_codon:yes gene_type:complete